MRSRLTSVLRRTPERLLRAVVAVVACLQLLDTVPALFGGTTQSRHYAVYLCALAIALLDIARRPARAVSMIAFVGSATLSMYFLIVIDVADAKTALATETSHLMLVLQLVCLSLLAATQSRYLRPTPARGASVILDERDEETVAA